MNQKEIACFRGGTRKQAEETGAVCRQSTTSEKYHTINTADSQTGAIPHLLPCGTESTVAVIEKAVLP